MAFGLSPEWLEYQLQHLNDDRAPEILGVGISFFTVATVAVCLRLLARKISKVRCGHDDYFIVIALFLSLGLLIELLIAVHHGLGKHLLRVGVDDLVKDLQLSFAYEITYIFCHLAIKISVLLLYARLFTTQRRRFRIALSVVGIYVITWTISSFCVVLLQCRPIHYSWDLPRGLTQGQCIDLIGGYVGTGATNTISDFAILILPMPIVWALKIRRRQKMVICGIFLLGAFTCAASIARVVFLVKSESGPVDTTYDTALPLTWSIIEPCTGIVCACLPILPPIIRSCSSILSQLNQKLRTIGATSGRQSSDTSSPTLKNLVVDATSSVSERRSSGRSSPTPEKLRLPAPVVLDESFKPRLEKPLLDVEELDPINRTSLRDLIQSSHPSWLLTGSQEDLRQMCDHASDAAWESSRLWV
ncbi:hypothetical protein MMC22_008650 [Lobaria immixta]|nr:hypothetical protein [Lobaria immixta]